jgi:hypothetical protein
MAMMAITTSNSINVNPRRRGMANGRIACTPFWDDWFWF